MKWIAIAGSWKESVPHIEQNVRTIVREIFTNGDGIVTGGALGVDYFATDEYIGNDPTASKLKIFIPSTLKIYEEHYLKRAKEGIVTQGQANMLIQQLKIIALRNPKAIIENANNTIINKETYFNRISDIVAAADELIAFQINKSEGTQDTIDKARKKGIPVKLFSYSI